MADSFEGLPAPATIKDTIDLSHVEWLKVTLEQVKANFARFGLLDSQVKFLKGWLSRVARVRDYSKTLAKKDNISGPGTAVVIGSGGVVAGMTHPTLITYVQSHPYISTLAIGFVAVLIGATVHTIRNWSK